MNAENWLKNKHTQPQLKFRCSYKKETWKNISATFFNLKTETLSTYPRLLESSYKKKNTFIYYADISVFAQKR